MQLGVVPLGEMICQFEKILERAPVGGKIDVVGPPNAQLERRARSSEEAGERVDARDSFAALVQAHRGC